MDKSCDKTKGQGETQRHPIGFSLAFAHSPPPPAFDDPTIAFSAALSRTCNRFAAPLAPLFVCSLSGPKALPALFLCSLSGPKALPALFLCSLSGPKALPAS